MMGVLSALLVNFCKAARASDLLKRQTMMREPEVYSESPHGRHAQSEASYWEARKQASKLRETLPDTALTSSKTDLTMAGGNDLRIWDFFGPDYTCPYSKERVGRIGDGGKWVCGMRALLEDRPCLVYSVGSRGDISFEEEFLSRTACEVHTFDPDLSQDTESYVKSTLPNLHFHAIGIGRNNGTLLSSLDDGKLHNIHKVMDKLGHKWVDVLKIDIEGHEWDVLSDVYAKSGAQLPTTQLLIEFHWPGNADRVWKVSPFTSVCALDICMATRLLQLATPLSPVDF